MAAVGDREPDRRRRPHPGPADDPGRGRRLGIDVGSVRIGVAVSDPDGILATPVETVRRDRTGKHLRRLVALVAEHDAVEVVVGLPRTLADRTGPSARTRSSWPTRWPSAIAPDPGAAGRRAADHRQRAAIAARGRGAGQGPAVGDRPGGGGGDPAGLARPAPRRARAEARRRWLTAGRASERTEPVAVGPPRRGMSRAERIRAERDHRRRRIADSDFALGAARRGRGRLRCSSAPGCGTTVRPGDDYAGDRQAGRRDPGHAGDSTTAIGQTLHDHDVVRTVRAFVDAAHGNSAMSAIQPGFYQVRTEIPAADAVQRLADPNNRVGKLVIPEGRQLDDTTDVKTNAVDRRNLHADLPGHLRGSRRQPALRRWMTCARPPAPMRRRRWPCRPGPLDAGEGDGQRPSPAGGPDRAGDLERRSVRVRRSEILATLIGASAAEYAQTGLLDTAPALRPVAVQTS